MADGKTGGGRDPKSLDRDPPASERRERGARVRNSEYVPAARGADFPALPLEPPQDHPEESDDEPTVVGNPPYGEVSPHGGERHGAGPASAADPLFSPGSGEESDQATEARSPFAPAAREDPARREEEDPTRREQDSIPIAAAPSEDDSGPHVRSEGAAAQPPPAQDSALGGPRASPSIPLAEGKPATPESPVAKPAGPPGEGRLIGGRYQIVRRIGEGGMGKVFQVNHANLDKTFALKIIHHSFAGESKVRDLFYREARLASSLSHPNIVSVVDFGEDPEMGAFMVMEFLEGRRLNAVLHRETRLSVRPTCDIVLQVAEALHYIHARDIVHCDIKTENILLCEEPGSKRRKQVVKLLDFGLARSMEARNSASLSGTPHYVAPERIRGHEAGPKSDIYGLGVLFYELLAGRTPWDGEVAHILSGHLEQKPQPPSTLVPEGLDPALEQLILRALEKRPQDRHKDMAAFIYELNTVMDMLGFGRRNRRGGRQKVVVEKSPENRRDDLARAVFDSMRLPMALLDAQGRIVVANAAFAKFIMGVTTEVEGLSAQETPLVKVWKNFEADLTRAQGGAHLRRVVELDGAKGQSWRLLMWLDPGTESEQVIFGVHPLDP